MSALVREPGLPCTSHVDERSAGFFALGLAKASGRPAVVICTSGTAAANYLPAVVEAREARVPLIVLTADRPPELRDTGAGQAIDQLGLFGRQAKWFAEMGVDAATPATCRWIRTMACRAVLEAVGGRPGAVHLNFPLREPLVPDAPLPDEEPGGGGRPDGRPWLSAFPAPPDPRPGAHAVAQIVAAAPRGVLVVGRDERAGETPGYPSPLARAAVRFAAAAGWPVLADPLSGARTGDHAVAHYDALLRLDAFGHAARPDAVLRVGDLPPSKALRTWLAGLDAVQVLVDPEDAWEDPAHVADVRVRAEPATLLDALADVVSTGDPTWARAWLDADARAAAALPAALDRPDLTEPGVARALAGGLPADATLFVAASMPIRDVEAFAPVRDPALRVLSNRGANGIDGTIATAYGAAAASDGPVVLLLGDVAFAHDAGSLLIARRIGVPLTIVLVDNGGGGIFDFLPIAGEQDLFETHVATPTGLDVAGVATAYGLHHLEVATAEELRAAVEHGIASAGTTLVHVRTDRPANLALHRALSDAVAAALGG